MQRVHGGNPPPGVIDFSTPMNPLPRPGFIGQAMGSCMEEGVVDRYYDPGMEVLREVVSGFLGVDDVYIGNGSADILSMLPLVYRPSRVIVVEPTFGDHAIQSRAWGASLYRVTMSISPRGLGLDVDHMASLIERRSLIILSNPNNPTGMEVPREVLDAVRDLAVERESLLVVDEAFQPISTVKSYTPGEGVVVVKTLTKSLRLPGARLGIAYGDEEAIGLLEAARQPWPLDSLTHCLYTKLLSVYGERVMGYIMEGLRTSLEGAGALAGMLRGLGLRVYPTTTVYMLVEHEVEHPLLNQELSRHGVYVRDASSFHGLTPRHSRVSIRTMRENMVLVEAFKNALGGALGWG